MGYASTTLTVNPRQDDYRAVLKHNVKRDYVNSKEYREPEWIQKMKEIQERLDKQTCSAKFTQEIKDCRILEGQKAKFEGVYTGNPPPEVTWEFNGVLIENDKDIQIKVKDHRTSLTILEGKTSHNGHYTCRVKNELGSDRTRALLTVKVPTAEDKAKEERRKSIQAARRKSIQIEKEKKEQAKQEREKEKLAKIAEQAKKPEPKPQKTWGQSGSKKAEPPKPEPEKKPEIQLKKTEPGKKPEPEKKAEMPSLKPTPKQQKEAKDDSKEAVQLKPVPKEAPEAEKKKMPSAAAPAPADEVDAQIKQS